MLRAYDNLPTRPWWWIVPLGRHRRLGDPAADPARLWTFQSAEAYRVLTETGVLEGDLSKADPEPDLDHAYPWMLKQADARLPTVGRGLLWLWSRTTRRSLIDQARYAPGEVLITVQMPRTHVLISEFTDWHAVLNSRYLVPLQPGETDDAWWRRAEPILDAWDNRVEAAGVDLTRPGCAHWPVAFRDVVERSWEAIFDPATWRSTASLQAVTHAIHAEQVLTATKVR